VKDDRDPLTVLSRRALSILSIAKFTRLKSTIGSALSVILFRSPIGWKTAVCTGTEQLKIIDFALAVTGNCHLAG
jgi:hypothetical protein